MITSAGEKEEEVRGYFTSGKFVSATKQCRGGCVEWRGNKKVRGTGKHQLKRDGEWGTARHPCIDACVANSHKRRIHAYNHSFMSKSDPTPSTVPKLDCRCFHGPSSPTDGAVICIPSKKKNTRRCRRVSDWADACTCIRHYSCSFCGWVHFDIWQRKKLRYHHHTFPFRSFHIRSIYIHCLSQHSGRGMLTGTTAHPIPCYHRVDEQSLSLSILLSFLSVFQQG